MAHVISARVNDELFDSLNKIAQTRKRKLSEILQEAFLSYLEDHVDYQIALDRLNDPSDKIISGEELIKRLNWKDIDVPN